MQHTVREYLPGCCACTVMLQTTGSAAVWYTAPSTLTSSMYGQLSVEILTSSLGIPFPSSSLFPYWQHGSAHICPARKHAKRLHSMCSTVCDCHARWQAEGHLPGISVFLSIWVQEGPSLFRLTFLARRSAIQAGKFRCLIQFWYSETYPFQRPRIARTAALTSSFCQNINKA